MQISKCLKTIVLYKWEKGNKGKEDENPNKKPAFAGEF